MTRFALALSALLTLSLNGSIASAAVTDGCAADAPCAVSLRMMTPPPARPADLADRHAARQADQLAYMIPAAGHR